MFAQTAGLSDSCFANRLRAASRAAIAGFRRGHVAGTDLSAFLAVEGRS